MRHTKMSMLICSLLVCSMVFSSGILIFGQDNSYSTDNMKSAILVRSDMTQQLSGHKHGGLKAAVDKLVEEGKLSREKAEEIDKYLKQKREERKNEAKGDKQSIRKGFNYGMVNDLVNAKIINEAEAEAIRSKFREIKEQAFDEKLRTLIQKGTITQEQADKVKVYYRNARQLKEEQFKKLQNMNEEQRKAFFKEYKKDNFIEKLVKDGVLTQEQAQALRDVMREGYKNKCKDH